jgi:hypothetical protein
MERINVRVEGPVKQRLEADVKRKGTSPSAIVRQLIDEHYRQPAAENCLQLAERLGILGSIKGLPADLTTNPENMEGFGRD